MHPHLNGSISTMEMVSKNMSTSTSMEAAGILPSQSARIEVIGVGGGGSNAVNRMILSDLDGVTYRVMNTDAQALLQSAANNRVQLGQTL
ncbi:MAG: cell division protein FtsZ, partial [Prochlorococcus sp.]